MFSQFNSPSQTTAPTQYGRQPYLVEGQHNCPQLDSNYPPSHQSPLMYQHNGQGVFGQDRFALTTTRGNFSAKQQTVDQVRFHAMVQEQFHQQVWQNSRWQQTMGWIFMMLVLLMASICRFQSPHNLVLEATVQALLVLLI